MSRTTTKAKPMPIAGSNKLSYQATMRHGRAEIIGGVQMTLAPTLTVEEAAAKLLSSDDGTIVRVDGVGGIDKLRRTIRRLQELAK